MPVYNESLRVMGSAKELRDLAERALREGYSWYHGKSIDGLEEGDSLALYGDGDMQMIVREPEDIPAATANVLIQGVAHNATDTQTGGTHYKDMPIQPVEYIHANKLGYFEGNVIKYVSRHRARNGEEDIDKAIHYLQLIKQMQYPPSGEDCPDG